MRNMCKVHGLQMIRHGEQYRTCFEVDLGKIKDNYSGELHNAGENKDLISINGELEKES